MYRHGHLSGFGVHKISVRNAAKGEELKIQHCSTGFVESTCSDMPSFEKIGRVNIRYPHDLKVLSSFD